MKHNVLLVTYYWPPSGGSGVQRILKFCKYLPHFEVKPTVLTVSNPTYPSTDTSLRRDIPDNVEVYKSFSIEPFEIYALLTGSSKSAAANPTTTLQAGNWKQRVASWVRANIFIPDARVGWLITARRKALKLVQEKKIDCILTTGPPHSTHFIGRYVQRETGVKWVADFRDPWTKIHYNQILPRTRFTEKIDLYLERKTLRDANEVILVSPGMREVQKQIYPRKYHVITNGFDPDDFENSKAVLEAKDEPLVLRHVGRINEATVPEGLFQALVQLGEPNNYRIDFIGNIHQRVSDLTRDYGLESNINFTPYQPHKQAVQAMQTADLLLLVIPDIENNDLILTGKLFDYIGSGTPIFYIGPKKGDAARIIRELDRGYLFEHDEVGEMVNFLKKVIRDPENIRKKSGRPEKNHPYSRKVLTGKLVELI